MPGAGVHRQGSGQQSNSEVTIVNHRLHVCLNAMTTVQVPGRVSADRGGDGAGAARLAAGLVRLVLHTVSQPINR